MARGFSVTETIDRPPDEVWAYLADIENAPRWMKGIRGVRRLGDGPVGEGARFMTSLSVAGRGAEREMRVAAWQPKERLALSSSERGVSAVYEYVCRPEAEGTRVTLNARCTATGFPWRLLHPLIAYMMKRTDGGQIRALKAAIEAAPGASQGAAR